MPKKLTRDTSPNPNLAKDDRRRRMMFADWVSTESEAAADTGERAACEDAAAASPVLAALPAHVGRACPRLVRLHRTTDSEVEIVVTTDSRAVDDERGTDTSDVADEEEDDESPGLFSTRPPQFDAAFGERALPGDDEVPAIEPGDRLFANTPHRPTVLHHPRDRLTDLVQSAHGEVDEDAAGTEQWNGDVVVSVREV